MLTRSVQLLKEYFRSLLLLKKPKEETKYKRIFLCLLRLTVPSFSAISLSKSSINFTDLVLWYTYRYIWIL